MKHEKDITKRRAGLYIHIPFCRKKCRYCDFLSIPHDPQLEAMYVEAVVREMNIRASSPDIRSYGFESIYVGGGTPTVLDSEQVCRIIETVFSEFHFITDPEVTIEANPESITKETLVALRHAGVNRMSIGVQSFSDDELKVLGRMHTAKEAINAIMLVRSEGFENMGIDLMFGIPGQSLEGWRKNLDQVLSMQPHHISAYCLSCEEGTPFHEMKRRGKLSMLPDSLQADMYETAISVLTEAGYEHYEISNFALPGSQCLHNMNYWRGREYVGIGAGAHSFIDGVRMWNRRGVDAYIEDVRWCGNGLMGGEKLGRRRAISEAVMLGLRMRDGIDVKEFMKDHEVNLLTYYRDEIDELSGDGLLVVKGGRIALTDRGVFLFNEVCERFF